MTTDATRHTYFAGDYSHTRTAAGRRYVLIEATDVEEARRLAIPLLGITDSRDCGIAQLRDIIDRRAFAHRPRNTVLTLTDAAS